MCRVKVEEYTIVFRLTFTIYSCFKFIRGKDSAKWSMLLCFQINRKWHNYFFILCSGDNVKYCSENSPDFFMKKSRQPQSVVYADKVVTCQHMETILINQSPRKEILRRDDREYNTDQESKSDSESVSTVDDAIEVSRRASGIWIEAKTKGRGRKKKTVKLVE
ncbi:unnamed protein product [Orchesella dallaii]|uniref:Uncharacterized protein n=1 Tax=Orchesella dallaii TaxID=48710 RepID=A0ABP1QAI0_9HEXA